LKDEPLSDVIYAIIAANILDKLNQYYKEKSQNTVAYFIKEILHISLFDEIFIKF